MAPFNRRDTLKLLAAGAAVAPAARPAFGQVPDGPFRHGVASGDPDPTSIVLWTRLTTEAPAPTLRWDVASDPDFATIVAQGAATTSADRDFTVKVVADGLTPGATYHYRFTIDGQTSPIGRTRTLPRGPLDSLGIAVASCTNYPLGLFNAYDAIARDPQVDIVFHTGDYIYEYSTDGWGGEVARSLGRESLPDREIVTLADYRQRHAQYKSDPGAQAMHAAHPFVACWDDHEVTNNPWTGGAQNHQPEAEGDWQTRRDAALQAYFEWMPIREPTPRQRYWRTYRFGDLATFVILETRHTGRDREPAYPDWSTIQTQADRDAAWQELIVAPNRQMLAPEMVADARAALETSVAAGEPWRLIGSASPIERFNIPDVTAHGVSREDLSDGLKYLADHGRWNWPWYTDTWDGYPQARQAFYDMAAAAGARDLMVLTGDTHQFFAAELVDDNNRRMGVELGTAGISSPSEYVDTGLDPQVGRRLDAIYTDHMPELHWTDGLHNGYVRVVLGRDEAVAAVIAVSTVMSTDYETTTLFQERIAKSEGTLAFAAP
ncbi:MAG: alkaline phosphatase D family protein [Pseudomonadota bacterium]